MTRFQRLRAYPASPDPRGAACNMIAMVVAWNQPTYPLYLHWFVGGDAWVACITFLSTPVFLAVPWVARRHPLAGRALLPLAGIGNGMLSHWAFGPASGVDWFLLPCAIIAVLAFRRSEWRVSLALVALTALAFAVMRLIAPASAGMTCQATQPIGPPLSASSSPPPDRI